MKKTKFSFACLLFLVAMPVFISCGDNDDNEIPSNPTENPAGQVGEDDKLHAPEGVEAVDLGLPSGTKWANMNVGATTPEESGDYFRWAETKPFVEGENSKSYPYYGVDLGESIAGTQYDAATANWGKPWKMPTLEQTEELMHHCTHTWATQNGVDGGKFTGPNGASIFFPASGYRHYSDGTLYSVGSYGYFWSATPYSSGYGRVLSFYSGDWGWGGDYRAYGFPVRAVTE